MGSLSEHGTIRPGPMVVRKEYAEQAVDTAVIHGVTKHGDDFISVEKDPNSGNGAGR